MPTTMPIETPDTGQPLPIQLDGLDVWLLPERALWWPEGQVLWVADLHLGKAAAFRSQGQPVPSGTTRENLDRLSDLVLRYRPRRLAFLGDFLHAAASRTPSVMAALDAWRASHAGLDCLLVRGNHDRHAGDPPAGLGFTLVDEPHRIGPFAASHHPQPQDGAFVLAGHVHPVLHLRGSGRDRLRLPCFSVEAGLCVLPAFGEFTGGWLVDAAPGRRLYPVGAGRVWALPAPVPGLAP